MKTIKSENKNKLGTRLLYMSRGIYRNYEKTMKEKNLKRKKDGLTPIYIRSYEEWSGQ